jgi:hypothetical protein
MKALKTYFVKKRDLRKRKSRKKNLRSLNRYRSSSIATIYWKQPLERHRVCWVRRKNILFEKNLFKKVLFEKILFEMVLFEKNCLKSFVRKKFVRKVLFETFMFEKFLFANLYSVGTRSHNLLMQRSLWWPLCEDSMTTVSLDLTFL